jgi:hypothetical protein
MMDEEFIKKVVKPETYEKLTRFRREDEVMKSSDTKFCPNPKCINVEVKAEPGSTKVTCH